MINVRLVERHFLLIRIALMLIGKVRLDVNDIADNGRYFRYWRSIPIERKHSSTMRQSKDVKSLLCYSKIRDPLVNQLPIINWYIVDRSSKWNVVYIKWKSKMNNNNNNNIVMMKANNPNMNLEYRWKKLTNVSQLKLQTIIKYSNIDGVNWTL